MKLNVRNGGANLVKARNIWIGRIFAKQQDSQCYLLSHNPQFLLSPFLSLNLMSSVCSCSGEKFFLMTLSVSSTSLAP